jgi:hypothetical protein
MDNGTEESLIVPELAPVPATLFTPTPRAAKRVLEFFTAYVSLAN